MQLENALENSLVRRGYSRFADAFSDAWPTAGTVTVGRAIGDLVDRRYSDSVLDRGGKTVRRWARASGLYRWMTTEPEQKTVVIDLRESFVVGPLLARSHWVGSSLFRVWRDSRTKTLLTTLLQEAEQRPVRTASAVVLVAVLTEIGQSLVGQGLSEPALGARLVLIVLALAGVGGAWRRR